MHKESPPNIDSEAEYYLGLTMEQRRKLPFATPCLTQSTLFRVSERKRLQQMPRPGQP